jgi:hypothetical protein
LRGNFLTHATHFNKLCEKEGSGIVAYFTDLPFVAGDGEDIALKKGDVIKEPSHLTKTKRINISIPLYALEHIDKYAKSHNMNRSTFLVESALWRVGVE